VNGQLHTQVVFRRGEGEFLVPIGWAVGWALEAYGLDDRGSIPVRSNYGPFSLHHRVQTGSGARPAPYPRGTVVKAAPA